MNENVEKASIENTIDSLEGRKIRKWTPMEEKQSQHSEGKNSSNSSKDGKDTKIALNKRLEKEGVQLDYDQYLFEEKQRISQYIIKVIEKNSVFVFLMAFLTFNVVYWRDISLITKDIQTTFQNNNFNNN